jgi:fatty acid desaturase
VADVTHDATHHDTHQADHGGRASSWLSVTVILMGFTIAGVALCLGPSWFLLWMGVIVLALGAILLLAFRVFHDVVLDTPRVPYNQGDRGILG